MLHGHRRSGFGLACAFGTLRPGRMFGLFRAHAFSRFHGLAALGSRGAFAAFSALTPSATPAPAAAATGFRTFRALLARRPGFGAGLQFGLRLRPWRPRLARRSVNALRTSFPFRTRFPFRTSVALRAGFALRTSLALRAFAATAFLTRLAWFWPVNFA
jgi:hypothetical protein